MTNVLTSTHSDERKDPSGYLTVDGAISPPMSDVSKNDRLVYADMLRAFAIIQVIYVHGVSQFLPNFSQASAWWACLIPEVLGRASVPIFLMLSGMFLLQSKISSPFEFLKKRMGRILVPLIIWSFIYLLWHQYLTGESIRAKRCLQLLQMPSYYHLGYLYFLTGLYFAVPILKIFANHAKKIDFIYFIALWIVSAFAIPTFYKWTGVSCSIQIVVATHLTGYFIAGYALKDWVATNAQKIKLWAALALTCVISGIGTYFLTAHNNGNLDPFFVESSSPTIFAYAVLTFLIFKSANWQTFAEKFPLAFKATKSISELSFSMYLLHPIVIDLLTKQGIHTLFKSSNFFTTSLRMFVFAVISISITWLLVKIARLLRAPGWLVP